MSKTTYKYKPLYQIVNKSMFNQQVITIPSALGRDFEAGKRIPLGKSRKVIIVWDKTKYSATLGYRGRKGPQPFYQIRWDKELAKKINETFVQSYVFWTSPKKYSKSLTGPKEALILQPINSKEILCQVYIKIENDWNPLLKKLIEENVFAWLSDKKKKYLVTKSSGWLKIADFNDEHAERTNVIYYLVHTKKRLLYVGKADNFGDRVGPDLGKKHQGMPAGWDKFRYDIIKPGYANLLERIEDHTIRAFAAILNNEKGYPSLRLEGGYTLVNKRIEKL